MQRRTFLATAPLLLTTAKGQPSTPRMGAGAYHYEALHDFLQPPPALKFGNTHGIVVTADGRIVLCDTVHKTSESPDAIAIDTRGPQPLLMVGERGDNSRVQYFSLDGTPRHIFKDSVRWPSPSTFKTASCSCPI